MAGGRLAWGVRTAASASEPVERRRLALSSGAGLGPHMPAGIHPLLESACRGMDMG